MKKIGWTNHSFGKIVVEKVPSLVDVVDGIFDHRCLFVRRVFRQFAGRRVELLNFHLTWKNILTQCLQQGIWNNIWMKCEALIDEVKIEW